MRYLFLGLLFEEKYEQQLLALSKAGVQQQANQYQWNFINGFEAAMKQRIDILASVPLGSYPRNCRSIKVRDNDFESSSHIRYIGFRNRGYLRNWDRKHNYFKRACECIDMSDEPCTIIIYSLYLPFLQVNSQLRRKYGDKIITVLIVPDLVGRYGIAPRNLLRKILYSFQSWRQLTLQKQADVYVLLTESMKMPLQTGKKPSVIIEGFAPSVEPFPPVQKEEKIILYTGVISHETGIDDLLQAFSEMQNPNYRLFIAGSGADVSHVEKAAKNDSRIRYFGYVSRKEIRKLQEECSVLVNARSDSGEYTKYSFPSKTMEYLMTGKPVVMHQLQGIPSEYAPYIFFTKKQTAQGLRVELEAACVLTDQEVKTHADKTLAWLRDTKQPQSQCDKLVECLKQYEKNGEDNDN